MKEGLKPSPPVAPEDFSAAGLLLTGVTGFLVFQPGLNGSDLNGSDLTAGAGVEVFSDETDEVSGVSGVVSDFGLASAETSGSVGVSVGVSVDSGSGMMSFFCSGMGRESFGECLRFVYNNLNWLNKFKNEKKH